MSPDRTEIGSEFHWDPAVLLNAEQGGLPRWMPEQHELFATGCGALAELLRRIAPAGRLHVPSYFCMGVAEALSELIPITWYRHLPDGRGPRWETLRARDGDVVLAQNLFGRDDGGPWHAWIRAHPAIPVIEDHSHDPFGDWARDSVAAYAIASLRKTLPLPDGGLLWSPRGLGLPRPRGPESTGAHLKLAAMLLKAAWRSGRPIDKEHFRSLQQQGEHELLGHAGPACAFTRAALPLLDVTGLRAADAAAARELAGVLSARTPLIRVVGDGPFRVQLECTSPQARDALQAHLARNGIFAPVHWRQDRHGLWSGDHEAFEAAGRMLTLPADHRCRPADLWRMAEVVRAFEPALAA
ncbi:hypothetical protein [Actinoplanes sp. DH11]|uniref:hypothetical protein n=1 Tax=Actinoplanes sp. DH11 TaxID=2857011 RepID=UPI001E616BA3|nr:hypothetical protein [Actinoplanes sp. DH11]